jgi:hypothetical protein
VPRFQEQTLYDSPNVLVSILGNIKSTPQATISKIQRSLLSSLRSQTTFVSRTQHASVSDAEAATNNQPSKVSATRQPSPRQMAFSAAMLSASHRSAFFRFSASSRARSAPRHPPTMRAGLSAMTQAVAIGLAKCRSMVIAA